MIIELQYSTKAIVRFPMDLEYDGHRVAVFYESHGRNSSGAIARCPVELWLDAH